jgi:hypothetical protein
MLGAIKTVVRHGNRQLHFFFKVHAVLPWFEDGISMIAERMRTASKKKAARRRRRIFMNENFQGVTV